MQDAVKLRSRTAYNSSLHAYELLLTNLILIDVVSLMTWRLAVMLVDFVVTHSW